VVADYVGVACDHPAGVAVHDVDGAHRLTPEDQPGLRDPIQPGFTVSLDVDRLRGVEVQREILGYFVWVHRAATSLDLIYLYLTVCAGIPLLGFLELG